MVRSLDKKWKEFLYAFTGFGPNFMMVLMSAYFTDAINPSALGGNEYQAYLGMPCFVLPMVFPILYAIGKAFDGIIDIPFAHITDTLSTKWGRRRPAIVVCMIPMIISFAMCWWPIGGAEKQLLNTLWIFGWALVFFATYTMCMIAFYGSLSTACSNEAQRLRVSSYKSFFDTISYCLVYALVPLILEAFKLHINRFVYILLPLMLTITIPLFLIKEGERYGYPENIGLKPEKISIWESIKLTFRNRIFAKWLLINGCMTVGLQMFLVAMNAMISGGMDFNGGEMAIINTCAFAPVPIMLYLFNKLKAKKGIRFTFQTCLLAFGVAILSFFLASTFVTGGNKPVQYAVAITGGLLGSWAIGSFFMMPLMVPAQISSVEEKLTGKNHSAMYFAGGAVVSSLVSAISGSLIYENIKMLFIDKATGNVYWVQSVPEGQRAEDIAEAALNAYGTTYNLGTLIVPFVVCIFCLIGFFIAFSFPKDLAPAIVAKELKKSDPTLDIAGVEEDESLKSGDEKGETMFVQIGLWVLSGSIFGFIWTAFLLHSVKELCKKKAWPYWLLACLIPFGGAFVMVKKNRELCDHAASIGLKLKAHTALHILFGILLPLLPVNLISLIMTQHNINKIYEQERALAKEAKTA